MIVTIHQPDFLPWLGFFDRWKKSDLFIVLDDVQFIRRGWHNRDRIKTKDGSAWLTVPVIKKGRYGQLIRDVRIDNSIDWRSKHLRTIETSYRKAPNFEYCFDGLRHIYSRKHDFLIDLNMELLHFIAEGMGISTPVTFASGYGINAASTERLVDLVKAAGGHAYLTGTGARDYLDESLFNENNIQVIWQEYAHPVYRQLQGEFIPMLSALDYIMMEGCVHTVLAN